MYPLCYNDSMVSPNAKIGKNTVIYDKSLVYIQECEIGHDCKIHPFVTIQDNVKIGNLCKIEHSAFIPSGVTIEDEVFVGQGVRFTNDKYPKATINGRLQKDGDYKELQTTVKKGASIGSNATILCGITVGEGALVGAGSVVTKDVPAHTLVVGNPAYIMRKMGADNTSVMTKGKIILMFLLFLLGIVFLVFPKDADYTSKGRSWACKCIGVKSWESFRDFGIRMSYCYGIVHSCTASK